MSRLGRAQPFKPKYGRPPVVGPIATQNIAVTNSSLFFSPYNVYSDGGGAMSASNIKAGSTYAILVNTGSYLKFAVTVSGGAGYVALTLDTNVLNGLTASTCPTLAYSYNNQPFTTSLLAYSASDVTQVLATGLSNGTYVFEVWFKSVGGTALGATADRWQTPKYAVKVKNLVIDASASLASLTLRSTRAVFFGDSHLEGDNVLLANNDVANDVLNPSNDARRSWSQVVTMGLNSEYGLIAYGGIGVTQGIGNTAASSTHPSAYNVTAANQSWDAYFASTPRDLTSPVTPDYIFIQLGWNDVALSAANVTALVDAIRTAVGSGPWIFWVDANSSNEANIVTGVAAAADPTKTKYLPTTDLIDSGTPSEYSGDSAFGGSHPNVEGHALMAGEVLKAAEAYIAAVSGSGGQSVSIFGG